MALQHTGHEPDRGFGPLTIPGVDWERVGASSMSWGNPLDQQQERTHGKPLSAVHAADNNVACYHYHGTYNDLTAHDDGTARYDDYQLTNNDPSTDYLNYLAGYYYDGTPYDHQYDRGRIDNHDNGGSPINHGPIPIDNAATINDDGSIDIPADDYDGGSNDAPHNPADEFIDVAPGPRPVNA